jgi:hypothetical protein
MRPTQDAAIGDESEPHLPPGRRRRGDIAWHRRLCSHYG